MPAIETQVQQWAVVFFPSISTLMKEVGTQVAISFQSKGAGENRASPHRWGKETRKLWGQRLTENDNSSRGSQEWSQNQGGILTDFHIPPTGKGVNPHAQG